MMLGREARLACVEKDDVPVVALSDGNIALRVHNRKTLKDRVRGERTLIIARYRGGSDCQQWGELAPRLGKLVQLDAASPTRLAGRV